MVKKQGKKHISAGQVDETIGKLQPQPRQRHNPHDDSGGGTGNGHPQSAPGPSFQGIDNVPKAHPGIFAQKPPPEWTGRDP